MSTIQRSENATFDDVCRLAIDIGEAAHGYGSSAARIEAFLCRLTAAFGYLGVFRSTPTEMIFAFQEDVNQPQRTYLASMPGTGLDLGKLGQVGELVDALEAKEISVSDATARLSAIDKTPLPWGRLANAVSYALCGAGLAVLFSLGWWDVLAAGVLGLVVYGMVLLSGSFGVRWAEWLPLSSSFVVAALATTARLWFPELNVVMVVVAAIAVLLPGYSISLGLIELVSQHVVSGTANLMSGLVYLAKQFIGAWLGAGLASILLPVHAAPAGTPAGQQWLWLFMPLIIFSLCIIFQTLRRDLLPAAFGCAVAYGGTLLGSALVGGNLGNLLGTIVAVVFANLWARKTRRPTSIVLVPAIVLLVSGSIGFRGMAALAAGQTAVGGQQFLQMFVVALTIAAGLLIGNTITKPEATL